MLFEAGRRGAESTLLDDFEPTKIYKYAVVCYKKQGCGGIRVVYMRHNAPSPPIEKPPNLGGFSIGRDGEPLEVSASCKQVSAT